MCDRTPETALYTPARHAAAEAATWGVTLAQLRALPDAELVTRYDLLMARDVGAGALGPVDYLTELTRREREREGQRLADQTAALIRLTWVLAGLTLALVVLEVLRIAGVVH
jgi:hypothetical protein